MANAGEHRAAPTVVVSTRERWSDAWTEQPNLFCLSCEDCLNPAIPEAVLEWRYGRGTHPPGGLDPGLGHESLVSSLAPSTAFGREIT